MKSEAIYALYRGEKQLSEGTATQLARQFGVQRKTIKFYSTPACLRRHSKSIKSNFLVAVKVEEKEYE